MNKTYDLLLWLLPHVSGFSRQHRFTLVDRIEATAIEILEHLVEASYVREKRDHLKRSNRFLEHFATSRGSPGPPPPQRKAVRIHIAGQLHDGSGER